MQWTNHRLQPKSSNFRLAVKSTAVSLKGSTHQSVLTVGDWKVSSNRPADRILTGMRVAGSPVVSTAMGSRLVLWVLDRSLSTLRETINDTEMHGKMAVCPLDHPETIM